MILSKEARIIGLTTLTIIGGGFAVQGAGYGINRFGITRTTYEECPSSREARRVELVIPFPRAVQRVLPGDRIAIYGSDCLVISDIPPEVIAQEQAIQRARIISARPHLESLFGQYPNGYQVDIMDGNQINRFNGQVIIQKQGVLDVEPEREEGKGIILTFSSPSGSERFQINVGLLEVAFRGNIPEFRALSALANLFDNEGNPITNGSRSRLGEIRSIPEVK